MTIYSFFIFDRHCNCIYSREFGHGANEKGTLNKVNDSNTSQLLFGVMFSLKNLTSKLGDQEMKNFLKSFSSSRFRIHFSEVATGLKFVLVSDSSLDNLQNVLWELYSNYYLKNVVYNNLSPIDFQGSEKLNNSNFVQETDDFIQSLSVFI